MLPSSHFIAASAALAYDSPVSFSRQPRCTSWITFNFVLPESALQVTPDRNPSLLTTAPQDCSHQEPGTRPAELGIPWQWLCSRAGRQLKHPLAGEKSPLFTTSLSQSTSSLFMLESGTLHLMGQLVDQAQAPKVIFH